MAASSIAMLPQVVFSTPNTRKNCRIVVIGGGFSGATAAKYLRLWGPDIEVVLIERNAQFVSCPQSNLVLGGNRHLQQLTHDYQGLTKIGVRMVQAEVVAIDTDKKTLKLHDGVELTYDRVVIAPGVDFNYENLPSLASYEAQQKVPHAWKAGPQTALLQQQIQAMKPGGTMVMTVPNGAFRCPPGPYERACQIAYYLKHNNPRAKLVILDANADVISKKALFKGAWQQYYSDHIEYIPNSLIESVDADSLRIESEFDGYSADVLNVIPPQKAGKIAELAGVIDVDERWCSIDFLTYESKVKKNVHVIGDAIAAKLPKSGHLANAQAKVCAAAIISLLKDQLPEQNPVINNTCYSFIDDKQAVHVAAVYRYDAEKKEMLPMPGGGVSEAPSELEGAYAEAWAQNIWADALS
jgi:NADPH-dependent 2,4-dienoyl-CoA reductase/sulfur reductase-like enzyme